MKYSTLLVSFFWIACFFKGDCKNNLTNEKFREKVTIHRLPHRSRYFLGYELEIDGELTTGGNTFISSELLRLSEVLFLEELFVASTQGIWRTGSWGEPPTDTYSTGSILDVRFSENKVISERAWSDLLNMVSSILCNSLTVFTEDLHREKSCIQTNDGLGSERQICKNYDDTLCSDNLTCWRRILPCLSLDYSERVGSYGILKMITIDSFVKASYKSIGLEFKKNGGRGSYRIFLHIVLNGKQLLPTGEISNEETIWTLLDLEKPQSGEMICPVVRDSRIYYFLDSISSRNISSWRNNREKETGICNLVPFKHPVYDNLYYLSINTRRLEDSEMKFDLGFIRGKCGITWVDMISSLHPLDYLENKSKLSYFEVQRSFVKLVEGRFIKSDRIEGNLVISMKNLLIDKITSICHWEQFPKFLNPWFYKTKVLTSKLNAIKDIGNIAMNEDEVSVLDSANAIKFLNLNFYYSGNIIVRFCIDIPPNTTIITIFRFHKEFLPLNYLGAKSKRGQISPPSVSYLKLKEASEAKVFYSNTIYHNSHIIPTVTLDHTMTFNVVAITSTLIFFGLVTTSKFIQLSLRNISNFF
ncbi:GPI transamidase component PIG-T [Cryptosporidium felis]|nr:GPI transamidase component PIG-T [Cryptosporidium felis]